MQLIGENEVISKARGKWHDKVFENTSISIMPSFHPAFLMRQPEQKACLDRLKNDQG